MLFLFGRGTTVIGSYPLAGIKCGYCGTLNSLLLTIYSRYLHFFWIPVIPLGKDSVSECTHCQQVLKESQMPAAYRQEAATLKQQAKLPVSNYLVLAIAGVAFVALMIVGAFSSPSKPATGAAATSAVPVAGEKPANEPATEANKPLLAAPQVNDMYVVRYDDGMFNTMRVLRITPDSLYMQSSSYQPGVPANVATQQDSVMKHLDPTVMGMSRDILRRMSEYGNLTVVRP
ncbi:hypothetical protein GCM10027422_12190 [Hymenobacter arcticus]